MSDWPGDDPFADDPGADPLSADHFGADHFGADHFGADHFGADHFGADHFGADHFGTDHLDADHFGADHSEDDHLGTDDPGVHHGPGADGHALEHEPAQPLAPEPPAVADPAPHPDTLPQHVDTSPFPPHLEVDVTPADGLDWVDPQLLGGPEATFAPTVEPGAALDHLRALEGADPAASDDPAIRALARFWS